MTRSGRAFLVSVISSVVLIALLWWVAAANGLFSGPSSPVVALSFPREADEREIVSALRSAGFSDIAAETTQWVFINDFGEWERVRLDSFRDRIEPFDPRDDGYAERVRTLFVGADKRFVYVGRPFSLFGLSGDAFFARRISRALGSRNYGLEMLRSGFSSPLPFILVLLSFAAVLLMTKSLTPLAALFAALPVAGFGLGGLASAGFLCAASFMFMRAFGEWTRPAVIKRPGAGAGPWVFDYLIPGALHSAAAAAVSLIGGVPPAIAALSMLTVVSLSSAGAAGFVARSRRLGHARFSPVPLRKPAGAGLAALSVVFLPFALSSALNAAVEFAYSGSASLGSPSAAIGPDLELGMDDYGAHMERQSAFLTTRVMDSPQEKRYTLFSVDSDGFASVSDQSAKRLQLPHSELPPAERFLFDRKVLPSRTAFGGFRSALVLIIAFAVSYPALRAFGLRRRRLKSASEDSVKRIAA